MYRKLFNLAVSIVYLFSVIGGCDHNIVICDMDVSGSDIISATDFSFDYVTIVDDIVSVTDVAIDPIPAPETSDVIEDAPVATTTKSAVAKPTTTSTTTKKAADSATAKPTKAATQPPVTQPPATQASTTQAPTTQPPTTAEPITQPPTTAAPTMTAPTTTAAPSMSISDLSSSAKSYATSIGMTWDTGLNISNSHWVTPLSSAGFSSDDAFKAKINERTSFLQSQGFTNINIYFEQSGGKILAYHFAG